MFIKGSAVKYFVLIIILTFSYNSFASKKSKKPKFDKMSKVKWSKILIERTAKVSCESKGSFYRDCYKMSEKNCNYELKQALKKCYKSQKDIPSKLWPETEGAKFAHTIGKCAGKNYHNKFKKNYKKGKICPKL